MEFSRLQSEYEKRLPEYNELKSVVGEKLPLILDAKVHSIKSRVKDMDSFFQKVSRKGYTRPFEECTDLVGFRVICLFKGQVEEVVEAIGKEFKIIEKSRNEKDVDKFSYGSYHVLCQFKKPKPHMSTVFEIQVRTILQEAWAEVEHYLNYKHIGIDKEQLRKINALSALFEIADDQFQQIHESYDQANKDPTKSSKLTPELLYHYCKKNFPWAFEQKEHFKTEQIEEYNKLVLLCEKKGVETIQELDSLYRAHKEELDQYDGAHVSDIINAGSQWPMLAEKVKKAKHFFSPTLLLSIMLRERK